MTQPPSISAFGQVTPQQISDLVDRFYERARLDEEIGPIFNTTVEDWPSHLARLKDFWATVLMTSQTYKGNPLDLHLDMPIDRVHFKRWLALFEQTAREVMPPATAAMIVARAHRIADNFQNALRTYRGEV